MKKGIIILTVLAFATLSYLSSCSVHQSIQIKSGAQLWGENCVRCHNVPSPADFSDQQWELIGTHMRMRANLTAEESRKIIEFLKIAN
jgi:hypothetical protein